MAYGTPSSLDELEAYYTHIRRGRPPTPEQLDELRSRYEAFGGGDSAADNARREIADRYLGFVAHWRRPAGPTG